MGVDILMRSAGFSPCSTRAGIKGFERAMQLGEAAHVAVFPLNGQEIVSPYDPVRCCCYDAEGEMASEETLATLFDLLERPEFELPEESLHQVDIAQDDPKDPRSS